MFAPFLTLVQKHQDIRIVFKIPPAEPGPAAECTVMYDGILQKSNEGDIIIHY